MKIKKIGVGLLALLIFVSGVIFPLFEQSVSAQANNANTSNNNEAKFIDKISIEFRGRIFTDENPYDGTHLYFAGPRGGIPACNEDADATRRHELRIDNFNSSNPKANITLRTDENGDCKTEDLNNITMTNVNRKNWNVYRQSQDSIFAPKGTKWDLGNCTPTNDPSTSKPPMGDVVVNEGKQYRRRDNQDRNDYFEVDGNNTNGEATTTRNKIKINDNPRGKFFIDFRCNNAPFGTVSSSRDYDGVFLAFNGDAANAGSENCIPRIYGSRTGTCTAENDVTDITTYGDPAGAAGPSSCEENNPNVILSWFLCSVINFLDNTVQGLSNAVDELLQIKPEYYQDERLRDSWAYFRNIASFLLIIIGLVMIIGQAISKD